MNYFEDNSCPVCSKTFRTAGGKRAHMSGSASCSWYRLEKLGDIQPLGHHSQEGGPLGIQNLDDEDPDDGNPDDEEEGPDMDTGDIMMDLDQQQEELSHFIPQVQFEDEDDDMIDQMDGSTTHANALHTLDDNDDDSRVVEVHPSAGYVIRMDETLHNKWRRTFGDLKDLQTIDDIEDEGNKENGSGSSADQDSNPYTPFASELDWRVAQWAVKDGPGQNAFDRLLKIPGVCSYCLKRFYKLTLI